MTPENPRTYYSIDIYSGFQSLQLFLQIESKRRVSTTYSVCFLHQNNETPVFLEPIIQNNKNKKN